MIVCAGCSQTNYNKWPCWPSFLKYFDSDNQILNVGQPALSNEAIMRNVYMSVLKNKEKITKVYIMWSGTHRYQVVDEVVDPTLDISKLKSHPIWNSYFEWHEWRKQHHNDEKHKYYMKHFINFRQNEVRQLERILFTQMFLEKNNIDYKMMFFRGDVLEHDKTKMSIGYYSLYKNIDWNKFIFYKDFETINEFAENEYPQALIKSIDKHPLPLAHYHWVKDIMYKSKKEIPIDEYNKIKNWTIDDTIVYEHNFSKLND